MKKAKWSEVPLEYRMSRAQKFTNAIKGIGLCVCAAISVFAVAMMLLYGICMH